MTEFFYKCCHHRAYIGFLHEELKRGGGGSISFEMALKLYED